MSLILNDLDKFIKYKYSISEFFIIINGVSSEFPIEKIRGFKIENYFEDATFPIFKLNLSMEASRYFEIIQNKDNVKFKLRIQSYYKTDNSESKSMVRDIINDIFVIFPDDSNSDYEKERKKEAGTDKDKNDLDSDNPIELFLFQDNVVNGMRSLFNGVVHNTNLATVVAYLLDTAGAKRILMSPFDNDRIFDNIVLPPQSIEKQIKYLSNNYGFHEYGSLFFIGLMYTYVLNCNGLCTAWDDRDPKETIIYILESTNNKSMLSSTIKKRNDPKNYINALSSNIDITTGSVSSNVITGINADIVDLQSGKMGEVNIDASTVGKVNKSVIFNNTSNPYLNKTYESLKQSSSTVITIGLTDVSMSMFTPNKNFSIIFESPSLNNKYKGNYRLASSIYTFSGSKDNFSVSSVITLKKVD